MVDATGWAELMNGSMVKATYVMYTATWGVWFVTLLFFVYQIMLFIKTRNWTLMFITTIIFVSMFAVAQGTWLATQTYHILYIIMALELAGIMFMWFWK